MPTEEKSVPCRIDLVTELDQPTLFVRSWLYAAHSGTNNGMFYGSVPILGKQRLKATSAKLEEK